MTKSEFKSYLLLTGFKPPTTSVKIYTRVNNVHDRTNVWLMAGWVEVKTNVGEQIIKRQNFNTYHRAWLYIKTLIGD